MEEAIPLHPDDVDTLTQRMLERADATGGATPGTVLAELPAEHADAWRGWAQLACNGEEPSKCCLTQQAWDEVRAYARELAEARA